MAWQASPHPRTGGRPPTTNRGIGETTTAIGRRIYIQAGDRSENVPRSTGESRSRDWQPPYRRRRRPSGRPGNQGRPPICSAYAVQSCRILAGGTVGSEATIPAGSMSQRYRGYGAGDIRTARNPPYFQYVTGEMCRQRKIGMVNTNPASSWPDRRLSICSRELNGLSCNSASGRRSRNCQNESGTTPCQDALSTNPTRKIPDWPEATRLARVAASVTWRRIDRASSIKHRPAALSLDRKST